MDDLISRQAALNAIDEYERLSAVSQTVRNMTSLREIIQWLPSAQSESIKCKDCGYAEERGCALFCGFWTRYTAHKGYCFKAERREENHG